jgi:hypothetical protein
MDQTFLMMNLLNPKPVEDYIWVIHNSMTQLLVVRIEGSVNESVKQEFHSFNRDVLWEGVYM